MKKLAPYVNLETVANSGKIEKFVVRTVAFLPADSKIGQTGEGTVADNVLYRPLVMTYTGTSDEFKHFDVEFTINRADVGLLERGVRVKVKFESDAKSSLRDPEEGGLVIDYDEELV